MFDGSNVGIRSTQPTSKTKKRRVDVGQSDEAGSASGRRSQMMRNTRKNINYGETVNASDSVL